VSLSSSGTAHSIAIDERFSYTELLQAARDEGLITSDLDEIFQYVGVPDFELVLTMLWHTQHVNHALSVVEHKTNQAYEQLRGALTETVRRRHVAYGEVYERLPVLADYLKHFSTVISLNSTLSDSKRGSLF
jgi:hypothetical protein